MEINNIFEPTIDFDFSKLCLTPPTSLSGGAYFTKILLNNKPLYFQTPKCISKQGFVKSGKKMFIDLMFDNNDSLLINWMENLEMKCQELLFEKKELWFQNNLDRDDIESTFTSPLKIYKSAKFYLLRINVKPQVKIFNENQQIMVLDDITSENNLISIIEIQGIKFSNRNFQMEIELKQSMTVSPDPFLDSCFIKTTSIVKNIDTSVANTNTIDKPNKFESTSVVDQIDLDKLIQESTNELINKKDKDIDNSKGLEKMKNVNFRVEEEEKSNNDSLELFDPDDFFNNDKDTQLSNTDQSNNIVELNDFDITDLDLEKITLKRPDEVYYEMYKKARDKAKEAKRQAVEAYIEAKNIKDMYMIDDSIDSDSDLEIELNLENY